jgi:DNA polymerase-3 subunit epsilon
VRSYQTVGMSAHDGSTRLADVTFCVLDLETTGTSDDADEIVEVGAVLVRGGEQLGSFQTMVRHPLAVGQSDLPGLASVLASLLEFIRGAVIVGHNVRFDLRFLNAALWKTGNEVVLDPAHAIDTVPLARRLLRDDADDCRLGTLAQRFQFEQRPTHRALADAAATVELLHLLIERATHYGAFDLDDLLNLPVLMRHRYRAKLAATACLPRAAGVACLMNRSAEVIHVVTADDLRHGVRSLFHENSAVRPAALQHLHHVIALPTVDPVVAGLAALRWTTAMASSHRSPMTYLQFAGTRSARLRVVTDRDAAAVVAGPMPRGLARHAVDTLSVMNVRCVEQFVHALRSDAAVDPEGCLINDPTLVQLVQYQRALTFARACHGTAHVGATEIELDDGRVVDVVEHGRSWADVLPPAVGDDRPGRPASNARALEATFVVRLLAGQPDFEIRETWSPQY